MKLIIVTCLVLTSLTGCLYDMSGIGTACVPPDASCNFNDCAPPCDASDAGSKG